MEDILFCSIPKIEFDFNFEVKDEKDWVGNPNLDTRYKLRVFGEGETPKETLDNLSVHIKPESVLEREYCVEVDGFKFKFMRGPDQFYNSIEKFEDDLDDYNIKVDGWRADKTKYGYTNLSMAFESVDDTYVPFYGLIGRDNGLASYKAGLIENDGVIQFGAESVRDGTFMDLEEFCNRELRSLN